MLALLTALLAGLVLPALLLPALLAGLILPALLLTALLAALILLATLVLLVVLVLLWIWHGGSSHDVTFYFSLTSIARSGVWFLCRVQTSLNGTGRR